MVLLPCGRCCDTCTCSCMCCECATFEASPPIVTVSAWEHFLLSEPGYLPFGSPGLGDRVLDPGKVAGLKEYLSGCGITTRWSSQSACVAALIAAEKAAILAAGGPPYTYDLFDAANGYPVTPTATSSLTLSERQKLWDFTTVTTGPSLAHDLLTAAATLADEAAVDAYLADLFDAGSWVNLDPVVPLWGYCSNTADRLPGGDWWLGWSIPYRNGQPFTLADLEALCSAGVPFVGGSPPLAWYWPVFENDSQPLLRSIVLASSTGNAIADRLIETGTQALEVVEDELGYELPDWTKTVTTTAETCEDTGTGHIAGEKVCTIQIDYQTSGVHKRWTLVVTLTTCVNREDDEFGAGVGGPTVAAFQFTYDDDPPNNPVSYNSKITSTASIRPYLDEDDCDGLRTETPCTGGLWQWVTREEAGDTVCCARRAAE